MALAHIAAHGHAKKKEQDRKHNELDERMLHDALAAGRLFDELDTNNSGALTRAQTKELLSKVTQTTVSEDGLQMVMNYVQSKSAATNRDAETSADGTAGVAFGGDDTEVLSKDVLLEAVQKFRYYLQKAHRIDEIFETFDTNKSGSLEPDQIKKLMQHLEDTLKGSQKREAFGIVMTLKVTDNDVRFILRDCDVSNTGGIEKPELLSALAKWELLAEGHVQKAGSCACLLS